MIAFDTNILLRLFVEDTPAQVMAARKLFARCIADGERVYISSVVLCETVWTMTSRYKLKDKDVIVAIERLLDHPLIVLDDVGEIEAALLSYRRGDADFADYLIGALAAARGARTTYTFDTDAGQSPVFTLLPTASPA